jgi:hypothetical protein
MESIARLVVAGTDLIEAEGRALKRIIGRLLLAVAIGIVALAMTLAGVGFVMAGLFAFLSRAVGWPGASLIFGAVAFIGATAAAASVKKLFK